MSEAPEKQTDRGPRRRLGEILVELGFCRQEDLLRALARQRSTAAGVGRGSRASGPGSRKRRGGERVGEILVALGAIGQEELARGLARQLGLGCCLSIREEDLELRVLRRVPRAWMKAHRVLPLREEAGRILVICSDPLNLEPILHLATLFEMPVEPLVASPKAMESGIEGSERLGERAEQVIDLMEEGSFQELGRDLEEPEDLLDAVHDAPLIKLVNAIFSQAVQEGASDIHLEPYERTLQVRFRIDGILYDRLTPPKRLQNALVARIKVMSRLDIAEKRLPQDGRLQLRVGRSFVDVRVSTLPTNHGERVVLRLLDKSAIRFGLAELGMGRRERLDFERLLERPHGILLVTGPTGSGKTTTLYAALSALNSTERNILTVEDPVEYDLEGVGQLQVNPKIELTFASGLRSILRQDPDVIMVGEIRDGETAEVAMQSSLTGHLVLSTVHTNDSASAVVRLTEMGVEPFLVASSLSGVLAQRLVRVLCADCREAMRVTPEVERRLQGKLPAGSRVFRAVGCASCFGTGYHGRTGLYELLTVEDDIRSEILVGGAAPNIRRIVRRKGLRALVDHGVERVLEGATSVEELLRVSGEV